MDISLLLRGLLLGLAIAAPVGPIGVLCIRRTLNEGRLVGFVAGMGAATADGIYGAVAAFGLTAVTQTLAGQSIWLRLVGGLFLCYLGIRSALAPPAASSGATKNGDRANLWGYYGSTLALTLSNPLTIFSFLGIFAGLGISPGTHGSFWGALMLTLGVFSGSSLWWLILSSGVGLAHQRISPRILRTINIASGVLIAGFGAVALGSLIAH